MIPAATRQKRGKREKDRESKEIFINSITGKLTGLIKQADGLITHVKGKASKIRSTTTTTRESAMVSILYQGKVQRTIYICIHGVDIMKINILLSFISMWVCHVTICLHLKDVFVINTLS